MYNLEYYDVMMELLADNFTSYLKFPLAKNLVVTDDFPNMILCCKSCPVSLTFIRRVIATLNKIAIDRVPKLVPVNESTAGVAGITSNPYMFHINISNHTSTDFIMNICEQKHVQAGKRHVIVFNIVDSLKNGMVLSIKSIMNKYIDNVMFIVRNDENFLIDPLILHSGVRINLAIDCAMFARDFDRAIGSPFKSDPTMEPMNICIAAQIPQGQCIDVLGAFVAHHMNNLVVLFDQDIDVYGKALRDFCIKIGAAGVPISTVCMHIIEWANGNPEIMHLVALMDHAAACVKKPLFALEKYVDEIITRCFDIKTR